MAGNPNIKPVPSIPEFRWNAKARRYIAPNGNFVKVERIRGALDAFITGTVDSIEILSNRLVAGEIPLAQWHSEMLLHVKNVNLAGGALESGGWYNLSAADFGKMGNKIKGEYGFLQNFAEEIASGKQKLNGGLTNRAKLYGEQGRVTYYDFATTSAKRDGFVEERSFLTPSESCETCISEAKRGYVRIGELIPIGSRDCLSRCNCFMKYRKTIGEVRIA
jgi:hypothetical protein